MDTETKRRLEASGFGIQTIGFNGSQMPLYAHKATAIAARGEVQMRLHIANPPNLNEGEVATLERKAAAGFFQWKPGEECLKRTFKDVRVTRDPDTEQLSVETSGAYKGCRWCRAELLNGSQGGGAEPTVFGEGSENESSFSPAKATNSPVPLEAVFSRPGPSDRSVRSSDVRRNEMVGGGPTPSHSIPLPQRARDEAAILSLSKGGLSSDEGEGDIASDQSELSSRAQPRDLTRLTSKPSDAAGNSPMPQQPADAGPGSSASVEMKSSTAILSQLALSGAEGKGGLSEGPGQATPACQSCDFTPKNRSRSGKPRSTGQLKQALDMHRRAKHGA